MRRSRSNLVPTWVQPRSNLATGIPFRINGGSNVPTFSAMHMCGRVRIRARARGCVCDVGPKQEIGRPISELRKIEADRGWTEVGPTWVKARE